MRFRILGPLWTGGVEITANRDRVVLAMLLLHANRIVGVDDLVDAVWGEDPPVTARGQLQTCVSRLRRSLPPGAIQTNPAGYGITVDPDDLDATVFARLVAAAHAQPEPDAARLLFRQALGLWQGSALAGLDSLGIRHAAAVLDEQHAIAVEDWVDLELNGGRDRDLLAELSGLVERFPLRERLRGQLMLALCRAGRQADALAEYRRARQVLHDELGIEPGRPLQELHRQILDGNLPPPAPAPSPVPTPVRVRCLPRAVGDFTGRTDLLDAFRAQLDTAEPGSAPAGPVVHVIDGMAGVGKTTLAVHVARLVGDRYPDAHLFIDLHGHSDREASAPEVALVTLLRQLGVPAERIPAATDDRVALWRSELARRRTIVVLDNAATSAQVVPLLPGSGDNITLITSRRRLTGLDGVRPESVQVLTEPEAMDLFTRIVGERALAEPEAVAEVVRRCGLLPLAIRLAAARLARRRRWQVTDLVRRLGEAALPELKAEDRTVAAAFALSYSHLPDAPQRLFRLLGLYPGERFEATTAAALADLPLDDAEDLLDALIDVYLVEEPESGSYRLHDLMREYAATLIGAEPAETRQAAAMRLFDHATQTAAALAGVLEVPTSRHTMIVGAPARPDLLPGPEIDPLRWFDRERRNHMAILRLAESIGARRYVWMLARAAWRLWYLQAYYDELIDAHERGLAAAQAEGDDNAAAIMSNYLASGLHRIGRVREAAEKLGAAHAAFVDDGDVVAAIIMLSNLAVVRLALGEVDAGQAAAEECLHAARRRADLGLILSALNPMGLAMDRRGDLEQSLLWHRRALMLATLIGATPTRYLALSNVAMVRMQLGHPPAERLLRLSIVLNGRVGNKSSVAESRDALGALYRKQGRFAEAIDQHRQALDAGQQLPEWRMRSLIRNHFGETLLAVGDNGSAADMFRQAGELAQAAEARYELACSLTGLASTLAGDDPTAARRHLRRALMMFREMNVPDQFAVEKRLAELGGIEGTAGS